MSTPAPPSPDRAAAAPPVAEAPPPRWSSDLLLQGGREAVIGHQGALYRLRLTASGKLILTK